MALVAAGCTGKADSAPASPETSNTPDAAAQRADADSGASSPPPSDARDAVAPILDSAIQGVDANAPPPADTGATALADASDEAQRTLEGGEGFPCRGATGTAVCDPATQWCYTNHGFDPFACEPFSTSCAPDILSDACSDVWTWNTVACPVPELRCACLTVTCSSGQCIDDDGGGVTVSCGACYGAPPAPSVA